MAKRKRVSESEVLQAQEKWAGAIVDIGQAYTTGKDVVQCATDHIKTLYGYGDNRKGTVLFKPTKCEIRQFRLTFDGALSYFVGDAFADVGFKEDQGFALAPYVSVKFMNADVITDVTRAVAMGNYFFTRADGVVFKVEYTFGYRRQGDDELVIDVHHSSLPFKNEETS